MFQTSDEETSSNVIPDEIIDSYGTSSSLSTSEQHTSKRCNPSFENSCGISFCLLETNNVIELFRRLSKMPDGIKWVLQLSLSWRTCNDRRQMWRSQTKKNTEVIITVCRAHQWMRNWDTRLSSRITLRGCSCWLRMSLQRRILGYFDRSKIKTWKRLQKMLVEMNKIFTLSFQWSTSAWMLQWMTVLRMPSVWTNL